MNALKPFRKQGGSVTRWEATAMNGLIKFVVYEESNRYSLHVRRFRKNGIWLADHKDRQKLFAIARLVDLWRLWKARI